MYTVTIHRSSTEAETNRPIYAVDTIDATGHVCDTLSWFSIDSARDYAREMSGRYLDCPIRDETQNARTNEAMYRIDHAYVTTNEQGEHASGHESATADGWEDIAGIVDTMLRFISGTTVSMSINLIKPTAFDFA